LKDLDGCLIVLWDKMTLPRSMCEAKTAYQNSKRRADRQVLMAFLHD
jgi:hypothetical protein